MCNSIKYAIKCCCIPGTVADAGNTADRSRKFLPAEFLVQQRKQTPDKQQVLTEGDSQKTRNSLQQSPNGFPCFRPHPFKDPPRAQKGMQSPKALLGLRLPLQGVSYHSSPRLAHSLPATLTPCYFSSTRSRSSSGSCVDPSPPGSPHGSPLPSFRSLLTTPLSVRSFQKIPPKIDTLQHSIPLPLISPHSSF